MCPLPGGAHAHEGGRPGLTGGFFFWVRKLSGAENRILCQEGQWIQAYCLFPAREGRKPSKKVSGPLVLEPWDLFSVHWLHSLLSVPAPIAWDSIHQAHADLLSQFSLQCSGETPSGPEISLRGSVAMPDMINGSPRRGKNAGGVDTAT